MPHLAEDIRIRVILQKHRRRARVVVSGCNVQSREADLSFGAVVDEQGYDVLMALLKSYSERSKPILQQTRREAESEGEKQTAKRGDCNNAMETK